MLLSTNNRLVMIGDSITDCDRARPVGEGLFGAIGRSYVEQVDALLQTGYPELRIRVTNMGISGNTVLDLKKRWQIDVLDLKPDWVSIMIGTNDVWRQFDSPYMPELGVDLETYIKTLTGLVETTRPNVKGIVLMTPFYLEPNPQDAMRAKMDIYGAAVKRVAAAQGCVFVDTQAAVNKLFDHLYPGAIAWDRVHPNAIGHMALARAFLNAIGFKWE